MKKIIVYSIISITIIGYFLVIYKVNNRENIIKREPKSLFQSDAENLQATITHYPTLSPHNKYSSQIANFPSFSVNYPDNWKLTTKTINNATYIEIEPFTNTSNDCVMIYQSIDNMPLLEAVNYSKYMLQNKKTTYTVTEPVETTINNIPTHISTLHKDKKEIRNAVLVKDNTYTLVVRGCEQTSDELFFSVLQSITFE